MEPLADRGLHYWWIFVIRGILFILLGIYMIASPASGFAALGFLLGLIIFIAGVVELLHVVRSRHAVNRGWHLAIGIIDIILGIVLMGHIAASETILRIIVGLWFLFRGISLFSFSGSARTSWLIILGGIITVLFALLILFSPVFGGITIIIWVALAFIITGLMNIMLGLGLQK